MTKRACDVMAVRLAGVHPRASLDQAIALMADFGLTTLPVIDISGRLVGILTANDILRRTPLGTMRAGIRDNAIVEEVMTSEVCTVKEDSPVIEVSRLMKDRDINCVPVLHGDKLAGLIGRRELARAIGEEFGAERAAKSSAKSRDAALKETIIAALRRLAWVPCPLIDIIVQAGKVELHGTLLPQAEREAVHATIKTIPGVKGFSDYLVLADSVGALFGQSPEDSARRPKLYC